jgi:hypothetical protein
LIMKLLMTSAALLALAAAAPAQAEPPTVVGPGLTSGLPPQAGTTPLGAGPIGVTGQVNGSTSIGAPTLPSAGDTARGAIQTGAAARQDAAKAADPGVIKDSRTLNPGSASVNASANVSDSGAGAQAMLAGGMSIQDMGGMTLGKVISVSKSRGGQVTNVIVQTADGVRRTMPAGGLTVKGGVAVTSQSEADLVALPTLR